MIVLIFSLLIMPSAAIQLPHCTYVEFSTTEDSASNLRSGSNVSSIGRLKAILDISVHDTVCIVNSNYFASENGSLITSVTYVGAEQHYPVIWRYEFAIPHLQSNCKCHCPEFEETPVCSRSSYQHQKCFLEADSTDLCARTYHQVASRGCTDEHENAEMCCDITVKPYEGRTFWAIGLGRPSQHAKFRVSEYKCDEKSDLSHCKLLQFSRFTVSLDWKRQKVSTSRLFNKHLTMKAKGMAIVNQLTSNTGYFVKSNETMLHDGVELNQLDEYNLDKLGWFRRHKTSKNGQPTSIRFKINDLLVDLQAAHRVTVTDCKEQKHAEKFLANHYVATVNDQRGERFINKKFTLGSSLVSQGRSWIEKLTLRPNLDRTAVLLLTKAATPDVELQFLFDRNNSFNLQHHYSSLGYFTASIHVDRHSNRYLNISFVNSLGKFWISVNGGINIGNLTIGVTLDSNESIKTKMFIPLPSGFNSERYVCITSTSTSETVDELCKLASYNKIPLKWFAAPANSSKWHYLSTECLTCNIVPKLEEHRSTGFKSLLTSSFEPLRKLFTGALTTPQELAAGVIQTVALFTTAFIVISVCRSFLFPLMKCAVGFSMRTE